MSSLAVARGAWAVPWALAGAIAAQEPAPEAEALAFVAWEVPADPVYAHAPLRVTLRIGLERTLHDERLVSLFRRPLELPVQVEAPGLEDLPLVTARAAGTLGDGRDGGHADGSGEAERPRFSFQGEIAHASMHGVETRAGRAHRVFAHEIVLRPEDAGVLTLPAPRLRFAHATTFREDLVRGRVPADRRDATVEGEARSIRVRALPAEGRPPDFGGAVGRYAVAARAETTRVRPGEEFALFLTVRGGDPLARWEPPSLTDLAGFHVLGRLEVEAPAEDGRVFRYDLAVTDPAVDVIPPIRFPHFDPGPPARYRVARTAPVPLEVMGLAATEAASDTAPWDWWPVGLALGALLLLTAAFAGGRARRSAGPAATGARTGAVPAPPAGGDPLEERVHARIGCPPALCSPVELAARLQDAGMDVDAALSAAVALSRRTAARYGAPSASGVAATDEAALARLRAFLDDGARESA